MLPPKDVYSAIIRNCTGVSRQVEILYSPGPLDDLLKVTVPANSTFTAEMRTQKKDLAEFVCPILSVAVKGASVKLASPFPGVCSPVKEYKIDIKEEGGVLTMTGSP